MGSQEKKVLSTQTTIQMWWNPRMIARSRLSSNQGLDLLRHFENDSICQSFFVAGMESASEWKCESTKRAASFVAMTV